MPPRPTDQRPVTETIAPIAEYPDDPMDFEESPQGEVNAPSRRVSFSNLKNPHEMEEAPEDDRTGDLS